MSRNEGAAGSLRAQAETSAIVRRCRNKAQAVVIRTMTARRGASKRRRALSCDDHRPVQKRSLTNGNSASIPVSITPPHVLSDAVIPATCSPWLAWMRRGAVAMAASNDGILLPLPLTGSGARRHNYHLVAISIDSVAVRGTSVVLRNPVALSHPRQSAGV